MSGLATAQNEPVTVTFLSGLAQGSMHQELADKFNAQSADVKVEVFEVAGFTPPYLERVTLGVATGEDIDIVLLEEGIEIHFEVNGDLLLDLMPFYEREGINVGDFFPAVQEYHIRNGKMFMYPLGHHIQVAVYEEDVFNEKGVALPSKDWENTWTWQDIRQVGRMLEQREGDIVKPAIGMGWDPWWAIIWQHGGEFIVHDAQGRPRSGLGSDESKEALQLLHDLYQTDQIAAVGDHKDGYAIGIEGTWAMGQEATFLPGYATYPLPRGPAAPATWARTAGLGILKSSKKQEAAWKFLKWLGSDEGIEAVLATGKYGVPASIPVAQQWVDQVFEATTVRVDPQVVFQGLLYGRTVPLEFNLHSLWTAFLFPVADSVLEGINALGPTIEQAVEQMNARLPQE